MNTRMEQGKGSFVSGLVRGSFPASLLTTGIVFTFGYATGVIFTIGDTRQLIPVFAGIIIGSILFSIVGFVIKTNKLNLLTLTLLSVLFLVVAYVIIFLNSLVIDNTNFLIIAFLMSSPAMAVSQLMGLSSKSYSVFSKISFGAVQAVLTILLVFVFSLEYELHGQVNLYFGPLIFLLLAIIYLAVVKIV
ncbi:MAG: hypothetical protein ACP5UZ_05790 [Thermoplasmata archaeon]